MNVWECRTELSNAWKCITAIASLVGLSGAQINRGEKQNSRWVPKRICDGSCIFRISLNQCAYKAISSTALSTITILKKTSFHDSLKFILSDSQELPNLWCLCKYGFFFLNDMTFKIFESHAEKYCIIGNCAGMRRLKLFISNNTMFLLHKWLD